MPPSSTQISTIPATTGGLSPDTSIPPVSQSSYQSPVTAPPPVTAQSSTSPPTTTQQTRTGRTSPSPAPPEVPAQRRLSLPTPSMGQQVDSGNLMVPSGGEQTLAGIQQVAPSPVPMVQPTEGESDSQGKPPGIEDIHALDQKLRSLFKDTSQNSSQADGETTSPPNTVSTNASGLASSGHGLHSSLSLNSSGNFAPGAFASIGQAGTPTNLIQTSSAEPSPQRQQVSEITNYKCVFILPSLISLSFEDLGGNNSTRWNNQH